MKHFLLACCAVVLMSGCGSSVKLDDVPVVDKVGTSISQPGSQAGGGAGGGAGVDKGGVTSVDIGKTPQQGPAPSGPKIVYFDYDSFVIKPEFQSLIETHARYIKADKGRKVVIEGHTDERGGREYNLALGQKRAESVRNALGLLGVADSHSEAVSFGEEKPAVPGFEEAAWAKNRRAEISYR